MSLFGLFSSSQDYTSGAEYKIERTWSPGISHLPWTDDSGPESGNSFSVSPASAKKIKLAKKTARRKKVARDSGAESENRKEFIGNVALESSSGVALENRSGLYVVPESRSGAELEYMNGLVNNVIPESSSRADLENRNGLIGNAIPESSSRVDLENRNGLIGNVIPEASFRADLENRNGLIGNVIPESSSRADLENRNRLIGNAIPEASFRLGLENRNEMINNVFPHVDVEKNGLKSTVFPEVSSRVDLENRNKWIINAVLESGPELMVLERNGATMEGNLEHDENGEGLTSDDAGDGVVAGEGKLKEGSVEVYSDTEVDLGMNESFVLLADMPPDSGIGAGSDDDVEKNFTSLGKPVGRAMEADESVFRRMTEVKRKPSGSSETGKQLGVEVVGSESEEAGEEPRAKGRSSRVKAKPTRDRTSRLPHKPSAKKLVQEDEKNGFSRVPTDPVGAKEDSKRNLDRRKKRVTKVTKEASSSTKCRAIEGDEYSTEEKETEEKMGKPQRARRRRLSGLRDTQQEYLGEDEEDQLSESRVGEMEAPQVKPPGTEDSDSQSGQISKKKGPLIPTAARERGQQQNRQESEIVQRRGRPRSRKRRTEDPDEEDFISSKIESATSIRKSRPRKRKREEKGTSEQARTLRSKTKELESSEQEEEKGESLKLLAAIDVHEEATVLEKRDVDVDIMDVEVEVMDEGMGVNDEESIPLIHQDSTADTTTRSQGMQSESKETSSSGDSVEADGKKTSKEEVATSTTVRRMSLAVAAHSREVQVTAGGSEGVAATVKEEGLKANPGKSNISTKSRPGKGRYKVKPSKAIARKSYRGGTTSRLATSSFKASSGIAGDTGISDAAKMAQLARLSKIYDMTAEDLSVPTSQAVDNWRSAVTKSSASASSGSGRGRGDKTYSDVSMLVNSRQDVSISQIRKVLEFEEKGSDDEVRGRNLTS